MVTVKSSSQYTELALKSFFEHTKFNSTDQFVLIDNDGDWIKNHHKNAFDEKNVIVNDQTKNTSENINTLLRIAKEYKQDVVFLSNDVIFTPFWHTRFIANILTIPSCNQTHNYGINYALDLDEFNYDYDILNSIAVQHMQNNRVPYERLLMPTYVCNIPYSVYSIVGNFDESFNVGGEDVDYRLRCLQKGIDVKYNNSFLLHFNGKSSWNGTESSEQTEIRNHNYKTKFIEKWGIDLYNLCIVSGSAQSTITKYDLHEFISNNKFNDAIKEVLKYV